MGMNVNPRDFSTPADSTKVVVRGMPVEHNDSIWVKKKPQAKKTTQKPQEEREISRGKGLARTVLNALTNAFLPNGLPGAGDMLLPSDKEVLEDINQRVQNGQYDRLSPAEKELYRKYFLQS